MATVCATWSSRNLSWKHWLSLHLFAPSFHCWLIEQVCLSFDIRQALAHILQSSTMTYLRCGLPLTSATTSNSGFQAFNSIHWYTLLSWLLVFCQVAQVCFSLAKRHRMYPTSRQPSDRTLEPWLPKAPIHGWHWRSGIRPSPWPRWL